MSLCNCPAPTALTEIPNSDCPFDLGQIQKIGFQRVGFQFDDGAVVPTSPSVLADWTALKSAVDSTKVVFTPLIGSDPLIVPGEAITEGGGDNTTLNGVELVTGTNPSKFTAKFRSLTPEQESALKLLICEKQLVVYLVTDANKIVVKKISADVKEGISIQSFFLGDRNNEGFGKNDTHSMMFSLPAGWSEDIEIITPEAGFNPLTDL